MAGTIRISSELEAKPFLQGVDSMVEALDDLTDEIKDTAKQGDNSIEKLTDSLKEAEKASEGFGTRIKGVGGDTKRGMKEAEDGLSEFKSEANSTARESAASFDGSAESIIDSFQEIAANAFAGFGAAGAVAGLAAAAGIGMASAAIVKAEEDAKAAQQRVQDFGNAIIDTGDTTASLDKINESLRLILGNADDAPKKFKDIEEAAKKTGLKASTLALAYAGNEDAIDSMVDAAQKGYREIAVSANALGVSVGEQGEAYADIVTELKKVQEETQLAQKFEQEYLATGGAEIEAKKAAIETINTAYDDAVGSILDFKNEETGVLDVQAYIDAMTARQEALTNYQTSLANSEFTTEQKDALNAMGIEAASAWMAGYESATPEQKAAMERFLTESAKDTSGVAKDEIEKTFKKPIDAKVKAIADTEAARRDLDNLIEARTAIIRVDFRDREGRPVG